MSKVKWSATNESCVAEQQALQVDPWKWNNITAFHSPQVCYLTQVQENQWCLKLWCILPKLLASTPCRLCAPVSSLFWIFSCGCLLLLLVLIGCTWLEPELGSGACLPSNLMLFPRTYRVLAGTCMIQMHTMLCPDGRATHVVSPRL